MLRSLKKLVTHWESKISPKPRLLCSVLNECPDAVDLKSWYRESDEVHEIELPKGFYCDMDSMFLANRAVAFNIVYLCKLTGVRITSRCGLLFLKGCACAEHTHGYIGEVQGSVDYYRVFRRRTHIVEKSAYSLVGYRPAAHYHMLSDFGGRLVRDLDHLPSDTLIVFPSGTAQPVLDFFEALGVPAHRRLIAPEGRDLFFHNLYWSPPSCKSGVHDANELLSIRERVWKYYDLEKRFPKQDLKIYVSRSDAKRQVRNETELLSKALYPLGFKKILLTELSFKEQAELFFRAKEIIAPHGAGLVNLMFSRSGSRVVELFPEKVPNGGTCYWSIASILGMDYYYYSGQSVSEPYYNSDILVDVDQLNSLLLTSTLSR